MMPRNSSSNRWGRERQMDSAVSITIFRSVTVAFIVLLSILTVTFFRVCGPFLERIPGDCAVTNDSAVTPAQQVVPMSSKFVSETATLDATLHYCQKAQFYMNMIIFHNGWRTGRSTESTDSCRLPNVQPPTADSRQLQDDRQPSQHTLQKLRRFLFQRRGHAPLSSISITTTTATTATTTKSSSSVALEEFPNAFTRPVDMLLTESQKSLIRTLSQQVRNNIPKFIHRAAQVAWGGPGGPKWYHPIGDHHGHAQRKQQQQKQHWLDSIDGGRLLYAYLRVLKWPMDLRIHVPTQLCGGTKAGCDAEFALAHTLEFREKFQPWSITPAAMYENRKGFIYHRGFSPSPSNINLDSNNNKHKKTHPTSKDGKHALVWYRPGIHKREDSWAYLRAMLYTLDQAIADSLRTSDYKMGKFNIIIDTHGFSFSMVPRLWEVKLGTKILQDHLPDRLGMVFLVNLLHPAEFALNLIKPFLNKEVRNKIQIVPHHQQQQQQEHQHHRGDKTTAPTKAWTMLAAVIEPEYIPTWLGGTDDYQFDPDTYYPRHVRISNKQGLEYLQTMPYHAH